VAWLNGGRPSPAKRGHRERHTSTEEARRRRCAHGKRKKGERRGGVRGAEFFGELGWSSDERFLWRGRLPHEVEISAGCARERRSSEQDGEACGELRWPERATPASTCVQDVAEAHLHMLCYRSSVGRQMRWSMGRRTWRCGCK
jgi:hypothetical protein